MFRPEQVARYYERNTRHFLRHGHGGASGAIHRAVWGPGVRARDAAFRYVDGLIVERARDAIGHQRGHVVDLGCGVGASLIRIARALPRVRCTGVTISASQAALARARVHDAGLSQRIAIVEADFCAPGLPVAPADVAFAVEAFVHASSAAAFLGAAAALVRPGGLCVVCDDIVEPGAAADPHARRWLQRFAHGWRVSSLVTLPELCELANAAGFALQQDDDLTPHLELARPRDRLLALASGVLGGLSSRSERIASIAGGHALQVCLARGWLRYRFLVWGRTEKPKEPFGHG